MARKNTSRPQEAPTPEESDAVPVPAKGATEDDVAVQGSVDAGMVEEAPGLPDLGVGDGSAGGDASDVGADLGSTLLDDLGDTAGTSDLPGLPDPADEIGDVTDAGWTPPAFADRDGQAMDASVDEVYEGLTAEDLARGAAWAATEAGTAAGSGDPVGAAFMVEVHAAAAEGAATAPDVVIESGDPISPDPEPAGQTETPIDPDAHPGDTTSMVPPGDDPDDERRRQRDDSDDGDDRDDSGTQGDGGSDGDDPGGGTQAEDSTPVPDEFADAGGRGPLDPTAGGGGGDPAPETEESGHGGLIGTGGDVDPDPDLDDLGGAGALDIVTAGMGAIDPVDSTLLGGDEGDLAALADEPAGSGLEIDLDDSLTDLDLEEGV